MKYTKYKYLLAVVLLLLHLLPIQAKENYDELATKYQKHNAVVSKLEFAYVIDMDDDSLLITLEKTKEVLIINDFFKGLTKDYIFYGGFTQIEDKEAYTLVPAEKGYNKIKVQQFKETHSSDGGIFYDDSKMYQLSYPSLQKGAITHLNYTTRFLNPKFLNQCHFQSFIPVVNAKVSVKVHRDVELGFKEFNFEGIKSSFNTYTKGKYVYYEWDVKDLEPYQYYGEFYTPSYYSPHIAFFIKSINKEPYFGTLDKLYDFYYNFISSIKPADNEELKKTVDEITAGLSDREKAKAIYYWVQSNIKYLAYEEGYAGFVPTPAAEVFQKRFGDCKGMSCLIKTMMDLAGIESYFTWVGTRHKPYKYRELPLPAVDNHMIVSQIVNDTVILYDGTFEYLDYGVYPYHIQGKEVLIGIDQDKYKVFEVPITPAEYSIATDSLKIRLEDTKLKGTAHLHYTGFNKWQLAHALDGVKPDKYNQSLSHHFEMGNNKFEVTDHYITNLFEYDQPAVLSFDFEVGDYYKTIGDEIYLNMNLDKSYEQMIIDTTTSTFLPLENDFYLIERYVTEFEIPEGFELTYIPKNSSFSKPEFGFKIQYQQIGNKVILNKELKFEFQLVLEDKIGEWNKMVKALNKSYRSTLVLKKKN